MTVLNTSPALKGRCTSLAHALFVCFTLIRILGLLYIIVGTVMIVKDGVLQHATFPLLNQFMVQGMPLGNLSSGLVYGTFFLFFLHTLFGFLGLVGVVCHNKLLVIIYNVFLIFGIATDIIFIVLFSLIIHGINSWIRERFIDYYEDFSASRLKAEVQQAFSELFDAMDCNGAVGSAGGTGCWDKYYPVMNGSLRVFILLLSFSIVLQATSMVLLNIIYCRLGQPYNKRSPGMYCKFCRFVVTSFRKSTAKSFYAVIQFTDVVCSAMLFIGGVIITQSRFVTDSRLLPIFENMRFNNYYLPGIVLGLGITMIVIGCLNSISCGLGCIMLCFKSATKSIVTLAWQVVMIILTIIGFIFWIYLLRGEVYEDMSTQLYLEFVGYGGGWYDQRVHTRAWNSLFVTYSCCGVMDITKFAETPFTRRVPSYCRLGATIANSNLDTLNVPSATSLNYFNQVCETPLKEKIAEYYTYFGVICGIVLFIKVFNIGYLYKYGFQTEAVPTETSKWQQLTHFTKEKPLLVCGFAVFTFIGLLVSLGIMITGTRLYFDDILGQKDIKILFTYIYIFGKDVTSWVSIMAKIMVSIGCVSFIVFCLGIVSAFLGVAPMYYVAVSVVVMSLLFKLVSILLWIPVRVSFDWDLHGEMYSALSVYYRVDNNYFELINTYRNHPNLGFNTLFYQGKCCLQQSSAFTTLRSTWVLSKDWPWTCYPCGYDKSVRWIGVHSPTSFCHQPVLTYSEDCTTTVLDSTLHQYDTTAVVFAAIMILMEVMLIIILDRAYKIRVYTGEGEQARGLFTNLLLNNRFINDTTMPNFKHIALGLCLIKAVSLVLEVTITFGIIMEKFEPGYFQTTEQEFLNDVFSGDVSLGYVTHALGFLLLILTITSFIHNVFTIIGVLQKWKHFVFTTLFVTIVFVAFNVVILGLLYRVLDVAYCCDKSPNCSYRTDTDSDTFQQLCTRGYHDNIHKVMGVSIAYVTTMIILQITCVVLSDRLYKRLQQQSQQDEQASGIFTTVWTVAINNRFINQERMPNFTNMAAVFMSLKGITMVGELAVFIGIILQKFDPNYFYTTEMTYLNNIYSGDLTLGYVTHVTTIVMFCVILLSLILGGLGIFAVYKGWRSVIKAIVIPILVLTTVELISLGLLSLVLSVAYCCDYGSTCTFRTHENLPSFRDLCKHGFQGAVFNVVGTFIGFIVAHLVIQVVALCLLDRIYKRISIKEAPNDPAYGMFHSILKSMVNNRFINQERMPNYTVLAGFFTTLKGTTMVGELAVFIGIILQKFDPNYFYTTEMTYLNNIYSGDLTLGYVTHVTAIVMFCVILLSLILGGLGTFAVYKGWRIVLSTVVILTLVLSITELICLGLLSLVLSVAYCCDKGSSCSSYASSSTFSVKTLCTHGFQGAVFNVVGTFIGFIVAHVVIQMTIIGLADRIYKRISMNLNKESDVEVHGVFRTILKKFVNNRFINQEKMPDFTLMAFMYVTGHILMIAIDISIWIAILLYVIRSDNQLDGMYVGTLYLAEMTRGANITLLVFIPISSVMNVCKVFWCISKRNTSLVWSTLPEVLRLVIDVVILGLYAQLLESIRLSDRNIYRLMYELTLAYLCINIAAQLVLFAIKDRLHKRIETSSSVTDSSGMITRYWRAVLRHRFFNTDSGKTDKSILGFCVISCFLVVWEIAVWIAVLLQAENPGYLKSTFRTELRQHGYDDDYFWRVLVTVMVMELIYVVFHVLTVIAVIKRQKIFMYGASLLLGCIIISDMVTTGLASDWLDKAYNCSSSSEFCSSHVSKLYELCGVFIGLNIVHLLFVGLLLTLCIYKLCTSAVTTKISSLSKDENITLSEQTEGQKVGVISSTQPLTNTDVGSVESITVQ